MNLIDVYLTGGKSIFGGKESPLEAHEIYNLVGKTPKL